MVKTIRIVTLSVSNLNAAERPYRDWLGYQPMARVEFPKVSRRHGAHLA